MKKNLILALAVVAAMASCQKEMESVSIQQATDNAISFSAYANTAITRGTVNTSDSFKIKGIGVFAFYQPAVNGAAGPQYSIVNYPTPDYMYNQEIKFDKSTNKWSYTPIKYWPNNVGDKLSFFAYAPYKKGTTWEDLGFSTDVTGNTVTKTFDIYNDVKSQVDYLFAEPSLNKTKPTTITSALTPNLGSADAAYPDVIKFDFTHVTSKVNIFVGVQVDDINTTPQAWTDTATEIEIKSIEFKDLAQTLTWTSSAQKKWTSDGSQDIVVEPYKDANINYGLITKAGINSVATWENSWYHYLYTNNNIYRKGVNENIDKDQFMFIAPQDLSTQQIVITYVVRTTDSKLYGGKTEVTNVITKTWDNFKDKNTAISKFEAGKQYKLYFLIGVQGVKVAATVTDWTDGTSHIVDVPTAAGN